MRTILIIILGFLISASSLNDARKANEAYRNGDYETAVELYQQAIEQNPDDARLHFNLGSALAKLGESEQAAGAFETAKQLMDDPEQQAMADYNAGTMFSEQEMYDEAVKYYRNALRNNPNDADAKHNYEMALRKQQEQEQEEQDSDDSDDEQNEDEQEQDQQQDQNENEDEQDQEEEQNQNEQDQQQDGSPEDEESDQQQMPQPDEITQEEAENILNALEQLERDILENRNKEAEERRSSNDKDW